MKKKTLKAVALAVCVSVSLKYCIMAYTSFLMQLEVKEKKSTAPFGWAMDKGPIFPLLRQSPWVF